MNQQRICFILITILCLILFNCTSCAKKTDTGADPKVTTLGSIEITAELVEIPGEIRNDPLYDYAHVMKYRVLAIHRGVLEEETLYVGNIIRLNPDLRPRTPGSSRSAAISPNFVSATSIVWPCKYLLTITTWGASSTSISVRWMIRSTGPYGPIG